MATWTRKQFLKNSLIAGGGALLASGCATSRDASGAVAAPAVARRGSANGDVRIAVVGLNGKGRGHVKNFMEVPGVRVVALCDADSQVLNKQVQQLAAKGEKVTAYTDFRKLLEDDSIDAVSIATPNHWHALMAVWACQAGKDVYVEKPVSHNVWEGRKIVEAARKHGRIVQAGTQSRSDEALQEAFAYIRAGNVGKVQWARGVCYKPRASIGKTSGPQPVPAHIDYDLWTGPAKLEPPRRNSPERGSVHYDWHWFWNYGGGDIANQGIHEMDMCRWALGQEALPPTVMSIGGRFGYDDDAETPNTMITVFGYEPAPLIFEVRGLPRRAGEKAMDAYRGVRIGMSVQCEGGYFAGGANGGFIYDHNGSRMKQFTSAGGGGHYANFIAAVRSRKEAELNGPVEGGHLSSALCHLGNISYRLGTEQPVATARESVEAHEPMRDSFNRMLEHLEANGVPTRTTPVVAGPTLKLVPREERFVSAANYDLGYWGNTMLRREYRHGFVLPDVV
jgi:Predicted dehydrogenases and related proteins